MPTFVAAAVSSLSSLFLFPPTAGSIQIGHGRPSSVDDDDDDDDGKSDDEKEEEEEEEEED